MKRSFAILGLSSAVASRALPARAQSGLPVVRAASSLVEDFALPYYAVQGGFFRDAGVEVELMQIGGASAITPAVVAGSIDFGVTNSGAMSAAHVRGLPLYLMLSCALYTPGTPTAHAVTGKASAIRSGKDLSGKVIGINTVRDMAQAAMMKWIERDGGDPTTAKFYELPTSEMAAGIESGRLDAAVMVEPGFTRVKDRIRPLGLPYGSVNDQKPFQVTGAVCNKEWADKNPDLARRVTRGLARASDYVNKNPKAATEWLARYTKIDPDLLATIPRAVFATKNDPALIQPVIDLNAHYGFLPRAFPAAELYGGRSFL